jgi:thioesterase domain-containing protein
MESYAPHIDPAAPSSSCEATETDALPIVLLPGLGGEEKLRLLSKEVGRLVPITYLEWHWRDLLGSGCYFTALASDIRRQIDANVPSGPFYLAGYSLGGSLAFACACDYLAEGRTVAGLAILDATAVDVPTSTPFRDRARRRIREVFTFGVRASIGSALAKGLVSAASPAALRYLATLPDGTIPFGLEPSLSRKLRMQLMRRLYLPWWRTRIGSKVRLPIPTLIFRGDGFAHLEQEELGWSAYCEDLEVIRLRCSHERMVDPENMRNVHAKILNKVASSH